MSESHRTVLRIFAFLGMGPGAVVGLWFADNNAKYADTPAGVWLGGSLLFALCVFSGALIGAEIGNILNLFNSDE